MQHHLIPLGPPSAVARINNPDVPVVAGHCGDRVLIALDVSHARRLAALLGLLQASKRPDLSVLSMQHAERQEWMKALVDLLVATAVAAKSAPAQVLPVSWGPRTLDEVGHLETGEARVDVSFEGLPYVPAAGTTFHPWPHLQVVDWSPSVEDAGELDDDVLGGFICPCGWTAIDKGPLATPSFEDDIAHHTETCQHVADEATLPAQRLEVVREARL